MLQRFRIGTRLGVGFGAILTASALAFGAVVWVGWAGQKAFEQASRDMTERVGAVTAMQIAQLEAVSTVRNAGLMINGKAAKAEIANYEKAIKRLAAEENALAKMALDDESRALLNKSIAFRKQAEPIITEAVEFVLELAGEEGARVLTGKLTSVQNQWLDVLKQLGTRQTEIAQAQVQAIRQANLHRTAALALLLACVCGGGVVFASVLTRSVTRPLRRAADVAQRVAQGDLGVHIHAEGNDESAMLLRALKEMVGQLGSMVSAVRESATSISHASQEISSGNLNLSERTEHQAATLEETSASLTELAGAVSLNTSHADSARQLADRTATAAQQGSTAMARVESTMSRISESSKRIADIIGVIDGIAFQTNILALNAAVEAARAGEQGRGFAVVASEVRALAQRVTGAASEVRSLITESVERVEDGSQQVVGMGGTMQELVKYAGQVKGLVNDIAQASAAQQASIGEVDDALRGVDSTTQQNAALVEEVAAAAQSLVSQTHALDALVGRFHFGGEGEPTYGDLSEASTGTAQDHGRQQALAYA